MAVQPEPVTLLKVLIDRRQLTYAEVSERLAKRAASIGLPTFSLGERHLVRLLGGDVTRPRKPTCRVLEAEFGFPVDYLLAPFDGTMAGPVGVAPAGSGVSAPLRTLDFVAWLASAAGVEFAPTYELVAEVAQAHAALPAGVRAARAHASAQLPRTSIAAALMDYYGRDAPFYRVRVGDQATPTPLAVVTRPSWIGHGIELGGAHEAIDVVAAEETPAVKMTPAVFHAAVQRLGVAEADGVVLAENPLYRLLDVTLSADRLGARVALTTFSAYALTSDLLANELSDRLVDPDAAGGLPLRDHYLGSVAEALCFSGRICAGGTACLLAIARDDDYALLVQERTAKVLNGAGRLAVVPKAFHQPLTGGERQSALSTTIDRELEEELLGRASVDRTTPDDDAYAFVVPGHEAAMTEPMRWLRDHPGAYSRYCTGFGVNLVSGNYEAPSLVVIDDPAWWHRYGSNLQKNWEVGHVDVCSSTTYEGLGRLLLDPRWTDEGLFSFVEGLRALTRLRPDKVRAPDLEVQV